MVSRQFLELLSLRSKLLLGLALEDLLHPQYNAIQQRHEISGLLVASLGLEREIDDLIHESEL